MTNSDSSVPLSQQAYEQIKHNIVTLAFAPGDVLDETSLQDEFGLGRTPIREALKRLALEKLVVIVPRRGIFVSDIGIRDLQHLLEVRLVLEKLAARLAAQRAKPADWRRFETVLKDLETAAQANDDAALMDADEAFHEALYAATENDFLQSTLTVLYTLNKRLWHYFLAEMGSTRGAVAEHRAIVESLKTGDGERAAAEIEHHILSFQEKMQAILMGSPTGDGSGPA